MRSFHAICVAIQSHSLSMSMAKQWISKLSNELQIESFSDKNATDFYQQLEVPAALELVYPACHDVPEIEVYDKYHYFQ